MGKHSRQGGSGGSRMCDHAGADASGIHTWPRRTRSRANDRGDGNEPFNGNAITVSNALYDEMQKEDLVSAEAGGMRAASSLARVVARRRVEGLEPLTLGMVYPFSSHNYDLAITAGINTTTTSIWSWCHRR